MTKGPASQCVVTDKDYSRFWAKHGRAEIMALPDVVSAATDEDRIVRHARNLVIKLMDAATRLTPVEITAHVFRRVGEALIDEAIEIERKG